MAEMLLSLEQVPLWWLLLELDLLLVVHIQS
jgi:hypothetical protein